MSSTTSTAPQASLAAALIDAARSRYSYSRKRWDAFDAWQKHIRNSAVVAGGTISVSRDRDLRRTVIAG